MTTFLEHWRGRVKSLAAFGDSVTQALHIANPGDRWANRLAAVLGVSLFNRGLSGTVLQNSPDANGAPRPDNGRSRYERDLLGDERADVIAILYGFNDARYVAAPATFNRRNFDRDYREVLAGILIGGYRPDAIVIGSPPHLPDPGFGVGTPEFRGQSRVEFQGYVDTVRSIARETGTFYAPVNERMGAEGGDALVSADHVHPNEAGHAKIAEIFIAARVD